jgi:hypothetical protein
MYIKSALPDTRNTFCFDFNIFFIYVYCFVYVVLSIFHEPVKSKKKYVHLNLNNEKIEKIRVPQKKEEIL